MAMTNVAPDVESIAEDAYLYGLQQVIFYETRFNYTQNEGSNVYTGVNRWCIINDGQPITADFDAVVTPNATTLYATAFLDLQDEPLVIEMPEVTDRYFSLQLMSQYGTYFLYAGNQFNGTDARSYLILPGDYDGEVPSDFVTTDVVWAPTKTAFANVRYALHDPTDEDEIAHINELQAETTITPLSEWLANGHSGVPREEQSVVPGDYETFPRMSELTARQVEKQTAEDFFTFLSLVLNDPSMPLLGDSLRESAMLERLERVGVASGTQFDWDSLDSDTRNGLTSGFKKGFENVKNTGREQLADMNGWGVIQVSGDFQTDWMSRAVLADFGWAGPDWVGSHTAAFAFTGSDGKQLHGSNRYTITFDLDNLPPVTQFWSIPIYDAEGYFVHNELDRYSINSFMLDAGLLHVENNELVIYVQHDKPTDPDKAKNWLPAPAEGFRFTARFYGPHWSLIDGSYEMPTIQKE
ncbi:MULTISPECIES: DUF1254 domain-containing protein [Haloferax]|uniref:DUF1254 domain-containing protein n=2 Tax=Haloferax TaxID=2251 RepID=A0A6G1Z5X7_9EURY|nr:MULTISPECIES: DUF1254 domain-containing protein [Haloferax]KAB1185393.1 DUF1254 domain-containing protein [Haloferax sp. CBA1149]MRW82037.1 DUF1254 domain-containing protein [Haloferax marinisediminis]